MTGVAAVVGNVGGGAAVQAGSWRALFVAAAPLALVALATAARVAPRQPRHPRRIAPVGALLLTGGCVGLLYALASVPTSGVVSAPVLGGLGGAGLFLGIWTVRELRAEHPLLDPRLFAIPSVRAGTLGMAVVFLGMFALMYLNGQYLQYAKGYSVLSAGVHLLPMAAALCAAPRATVPLSARLGPAGTVGIGLAFVTAGLFGASFVSSTTPYPWYALCIVLIAAGCGTATPPLSHGIVSALPADRAGMGSGLQSVARELGSAFGVAVVASVLDARFAALLPPALHGAAGPSTVAAAHARTADPALQHDVVTAFTTAMSDGLRTAAAIVVVLGIAVVAWLPRTGPAASG
jgi:predicted MFS family arabinose efflux permease